MAAVIRCCQVFAVIVFCSLHSLNTQFAPPQKEKFYADKNDVSHIKCQVCQKAVRRLHKEVKRSREVAVKNKVSEEEILNIVEKFCNPEKKEGAWIATYDIVEEKKGLQLSEYLKPSKCKQECRSISKACEDSVSEIDTDLAELLWKNTINLSKLINKACYEMTSACSSKKLKYVRGKRKDETFIPMTDDERKADDVMKQMSGVPGMPGMEMYSREDMEKMKDNIGETHPKESAEEPAKKEPINTNYSANLSFTDTIAVVAKNVFTWFKRIFGFAKKSEL